MATSFFGLINPAVERAIAGGVGGGITNAVGSIVGKTVAQQQQEAATKALQGRLTAMLQKNQNFSTGQNNMLNQAQAVAQQRLASRQIAQPYNTAAPYEFAQDQAYTNPRQNLRKLPTGFDKKDVVAPPPPPVAPDERPITAQPYDPFVPPFGKPINPRPSPLVFPTAPPTSVNPSVSNFGEYSDNNQRYSDTTGPDSNYFVEATPAPNFLNMSEHMTGPGVGGQAPVHPEMVSNDRASLRDSIDREAMYRGGGDGGSGAMSRGGEGGNRGAMFAGGGLASLPQTNYYKTPDLLQPESQQPQPTQPVMQPFTRQRVQAVIPNAWDKKAPAPQAHVDPVILDTVTKLSQGITPLEGQNRGGGQGSAAPAPGSGAAQFGGSGFTGASDSGPSTGAASMANKAAAVLGNLGLTRMSNGLAANVGTNYGNEGRNSVAPSSAGPTGPDGGPTGSRASDGGWGGEGRGGSGGSGGGDGGGAATGGSGGDASGGGDRGTRGGFSAGGYISPRPKKKR